MRTKSTICILTMAIVVAGIQNVQAGDKEKYLAGGLIGGWLLNEVFDRSCVDVHSTRKIVVEHRSCERRPAGHYEYRTVKVWVPGYHRQTVNRCGRVEYCWVPGHFECRTEKVWVSHEHRISRNCHGRGRRRR